MLRGGKRGTERDRRALRGSTSQNEPLRYGTQDTILSLPYRCFLPRFPAGLPQVKPAPRTGPCVQPYRSGLSAPTYGTAAPGRSNLPPRGEPLAPTRTAARRAQITARKDVQKLIIKSIGFVLKCDRFLYIFFLMSPRSFSMCYILLYLYIH